MPSKRERLEELPRSAIDELLRWYWWRNSLGDDWRGLRKDEAIEELERRLTVLGLDKLLADYDDDRPHFDDDLLARVIGLPSKEDMLASRSVKDLRAVMENLEAQGGVRVQWRSWLKEDLTDYLGAKLAAADLATLLGILKPKQPKRARKARGRSTQPAATAAPPPPPPSPPAPSARPPATTPDDKFGSYSLVKRLTRGGMSEAWEARAADGSRVFLKRVLDNSAPVARALMREQTIYAMLQRITANHDHLLAVLDWVREDGWAALVTEFADAGDLTSLVAKEGPMTTTAAAVVAGELAEGLITLHANKIVHRDIKPDNVVFTRGHWRISDFGIAKNLDRLQTQHTFQAMGTRKYMSPEQVDGHEASAPMDIYAFGKLLTFLVTGETDPDEVHFPKYRALVYACTDRIATNRPTAVELAKRIREVA